MSQYQETWCEKPAFPALLEAWQSSPPYTVSLDQSPQPTAQSIRLLAVFSATGGIYSNTRFNPSQNNWFTNDNITNLDDSFPQQYFLS